MLACWKTLRHVSPLRGSVFLWEPITWGWHRWHPRLLHSTLPAFRPVPARRVEMAVEKKASLSAKKSASGLGWGRRVGRDLGVRDLGIYIFFAWMYCLPSSSFLLLDPPKGRVKERWRQWCRQRIDVSITVLDSSSHHGHGTHARQLTQYS
jgi:hypothetical protein